MAEKNANIRINLDNKQAIDGINKMNKSVKETGKEVEKASTRLENLRDELTGMERGSKAFTKMEKEAAKLQNQVDTVNRRVTALSSDTFALEGAVGVIGTMTSAYAGVQGAVALLGVENEALMQTMVKLQAVQAVSQSIQQVAINLRKDSVAMIFLQIKAQKIRNAMTSVGNRINRIAASITSSMTIRTGAQTAATVAQSAATSGATLATRALSTAMKAIPILALIGGIAALVTWLVNWGDEEEEVTKSTEELNKEQTENIRLMNIRQKLIQKLDDFRKTRRGLENEKEELRIRRQLMIAEKELSDIKRDQPNNVEAELKAQIKLNQLNMKMAQQKKETQLDEFDRQAVINNEELNLALKQQSRLDRTTESGKRHYEELQNQIEDLADAERLMSEKRSNLEFSLTNDITKLRFENEKKVHDLKISNQRRIREETTKTSNLSIKLNDKETEVKEKASINWIATMGEAMREFRKQQIKETEEAILINAEMVQRVQESIYKLSDAIQSTIDGDFNSINANMRLMQEGLLGPGGFMESFKESGLNLAEFLKENMVEIASTIAIQTSQILGKMNEDFINQEKSKLEDLQQSQTDNLQRQLDDRSISQQEYQNRVAEMEQTHEMQKRELARQGFQRQKSLAIAEASVLTAQGVVQGLAQYGPTPVGIAAMAAAAAIGAVQIGLISSQSFQAARGGVVPGEGLGSEDTVPAMLAPGEVVINSRSAKAFLPLLSMLNEAGGGMQLAPDVLSSTQTAPRVYKRETKQQPIQTFVAFDSLDAMQKQVNRTIKNNSF